MSGCVLTWGAARQEKEDIALWHALHEDGDQEDLDQAELVRPLRIRLFD